MSHKSSRDSTAAFHRPRKDSWGLVLMGVRGSRSLTDITKIQATTRRQQTHQEAVDGWSFQLLFPIKKNVLLPNRFWIEFIISQSERRSLGRDSCSSPNVAYLLEILKGFWHKIKLEDNILAACGHKRNTKPSCSYLASSSRRGRKIKDSEATDDNQEWTVWMWCSICCNTEVNLSVYFSQRAETAAIRPKTSGGQQTDRISEAQMAARNI